MTTYTALYLYCTCTAHLLIMHCIYTEHILHIYCTYTIYTRILHIYCTCTAHILYIYCAHTVYIVHMYCLLRLSGQFMYQRRSDVDRCPSGCCSQGHSARCVCPSVSDQTEHDEKGWRTWTLMGYCQTVKLSNCILKDRIREYCVG